MDISTRIESIKNCSFLALCPLGGAREALRTKKYVVVADNLLF